MPPARSPNPKSPATPRTKRGGAPDVPEAEAPANVFELLSEPLLERIVREAGVASACACARTCRRLRAVGRRLSELAYPAERLTKVIRVVETNTWPYEFARGVLARERRAPIELELGRSAHLDQPEYCRVYLFRPHTYVQWSLVQNYDDELDPTPAAGVGPEQLDYVESAWVRVTYVLFASKRPADDARLNKLRRLLRTRGIDGVPWPSHLRPTRLYHAGSLEEQPQPRGQPGARAGLEAEGGPAGAQPEAPPAVGADGDNAIAWWARSADWFEARLPYRRLEVTRPKGPADRVRVIRDSAADAPAEGADDEWCRPCVAQVSALYHLRSALPTHVQLVRTLLQYVECMQGILFKTMPLFEPGAEE